MTQTFDPQRFDAIRDLYRRLADLIAPNDTDTDDNQEDQ